MLRDWSSGSAVLQLAGFIVKICICQLMSHLHQMAASDAEKMCDSKAMSGISARLVMKIVLHQSYHVICTCLPVPGYLYLATCTCLNVPAYLYLLLLKYGTAFNDRKGAFDIPNTLAYLWLSRITNHNKGET